MASPQNNIQLALFEMEQTQLGDGSFIVKPKRLTTGKEIGVEAAMKMLGFRDRETIYGMIARGELSAWKPKSKKGNAKWRIAWDSVADYKSRRLAAARAGVEEM